MPVKELMQACREARASRELPKKYPYKPDKIVRVEGWTIKFYNADQTATCKPKRMNVTYVITPDTDQINNIPQKVVKELLKYGFLQKWRDAKVQQSVTRLSEIYKKIEKLKLPPEQRQYEHQD